MEVYDLERQLIFDGHSPRHFQVLFYGAGEVRRIAARTDLYIPEVQPHALLHQQRHSHGAVDASTEQCRHFLSVQVLHTILFSLVGIFRHMFLVLRRKDTNYKWKMNHERAKKDKKYKLSAVRSHKNVVPQSSFWNFFQEICTIFQKNYVILQRIHRNLHDRHTHQQRQRPLPPQPYIEQRMKARKVLMFGILFLLSMTVQGQDGGDVACPVVRMETLRLPDMQIPRAGHSTFCLDGELVVMGGHRQV